MKQTIGLIGAGNMGTAILEGALKERVVTHSGVWIYDKVQEKTKNFSRKTRVRITNNIRDLCRKADVILLAMKPQDFADFAKENKIYFKKSTGVISIMAGLSIQKVRQALGRVKVVRVMPNLGAKVGQSMTVITGKNKKLLGITGRIFGGCGEVAILPEKTFDYVTAISGCGPAYFFHLMELLADFGVKQGIPQGVAAELAVQTGLGAALLAKSSKVSCGELRKMVTSKKGTTEAALKVLERKKFGKIFHLGLHAAAKRSRELRKK